MLYSGHLGMLKPSLRALNLSRPVTDLIPFIESGVRGVTSNPTIFAKAISSSNAYDDQFRQLMREGNEVEDAYWGLVVKDIQDALDLFLPIYEESKGEDGYVSVEVSPSLAHDTEGTVNAAKSLHKSVNRPNVYIKIPATLDCVPSVKSVISAGISVNVTLIFSLPRYEAVIDAYLEGLEEAAAAGFDLSKLSSVASFFVSRVDTMKDKKLEAIGTEEAFALRRKAANAQAALAFKLYQEKFSGPRWEALAKQGAKKQRLLWASTGVKNPSYPDTHYISPLIGPDTVNTMPRNALDAFLDHGCVARTIDADLDEAQQIYDEVEKFGIEWSDVGSLLEVEGVASFKQSFDDLIVYLHQKAIILKIFFPWMSVRVISMFSLIHEAHQNELASLREEHQAQIDVHKAACGTEIASLKAQHMEEITRLHTEHAEEVARFSLKLEQNETEKMDSMLTNTSLSLQLIVIRRQSTQVEAKLERVETQLQVMQSVF